jgi:DNA-binding NtrC family response regulator
VVPTTDPSLGATVPKEGAMTHTLVVDDDVDSASMLGELLALEGLTVATAHSLRDARKQMALQTPDLVLLDLQLPDGNGMDLFADPELLSNSEVVLMTGHASLDTSILALRLGATDYLVKPLNLKHLQGILSRVTKPAVLKAEVADLTAHLAAAGNFGQLWGRSPSMQRVYEQISRVAGTGVTVFVTGESGTGKEVVAQTIHDLSRRRKMPFLGVNCGAISPNLIESEIFGHEKGSFTGADRQHQGFFERAAGGTLFLDEITEMPLDLQVKLLRVLETGRFMRVGASQSQETDVRIIAATNRSPLDAVASGRLREDLMYRLNVFPIELPPLRQRLADVPLLADRFLDLISKQEGKRKTLSPDALRQLNEHDWPGNVRELRNAVHRAYVMATGNVIDAQWLPRRHEAVVRTAPVPSKILVAPPDGGDDSLTIPLGTTLAQAEQAIILATLRHYSHQKERTAAALGISLKTLYNRLKLYAADEHAGPGGPM